MFSLKKTHISIINREEKFEKVKLVSPNLIYNRFDLKYDNDFILLMIKQYNNQFYIPIRLEKDYCLLGIYMTQVSKFILNDIFKFIYQKYGIDKFKFSKSLNNYIGLREGLNWVLELPETVEQYESMFSAKSKYNKRYLLRKLDKRFNVDFKYYSKNEITDDLLQQFLETKRLKYSNIYASNYSPQNLMKDFAITDVFCLKLDGKIASMILYSILDDIQMYCVALTYNPEFSKYGIGTLLYYHSINILIGRNYKKIYLGGGNDNYKENSKAKKYIVYNGTVRYLPLKNKIFSTKKIYKKGKLNLCFTVLGLEFCYGNIGVEKLNSLNFLNKINFNKRIKCLVKKYKNKKILFYGAGRFFRLMLDNYDLSNFNIVGVCDNVFYNKKQDKFEGYSAYAPDEINNLEFDVVLVSLIRSNEVISKLKMNFDELRLEKSVEPIIDVPVKMFFKNS